MDLLPFQKICVERMGSYLGQVRRWSTEAPSLPNIAQTAWDSIEHDSLTRPYCTVRNSHGKSIPCASIVIPTGGGKTITAMASGIEALRILHDSWSFLVWTVPSESIFTQTKRYLTDGYLRDYALNSGFAGINVKTIGDTWTDLDLDDSLLTVLLVSQQSIFGERSDLHFKRTSDALRHLSVWSEVDAEPTLLNLLSLIQPVFVIDECHRTYTETGRAFFRDTALASAVLEFSATPKDFSENEYPNVLHSVQAVDLIDEQLLKNPLICHFDPNASAEKLITDAVRDRKNIERNLRKVGFAPKPKFLISCRRTSEQHANDPLSVQSIRALLLACGVKESGIAIKTAEQDDLGTIDIDSPTCQFEFVLTQRALVEGWDAKTVFGIVLLNEIGASLTNFQIVGRGLRQPGKKYFERSELNAVHVYANSERQDAALKKLKTFLDGEGLSSGLSITHPGTTTNLSPTYIDSRRISAPAIDLQVSETFLAAEASLRLSKRPPKLFSTDDVIAVLGVPERATAVLDLRSGNQSTPMLSRRVSRHDISIDLWCRRFTSGTVRSLAPYFRESSDCLRWVKQQLVEFQTSPNFSLLQRFEPVRISRFIVPEVQEHYEKYLHSVLLEAIEDAVVCEKEFAGDLVSPIFALPDSFGSQAFTNSVIGDVPKSLFNDDELDFARHLDVLNISWFRNQPGRGWYSVGGGSGSRFYPDFVVLLQESESRKFGRVIAVETKGSHLLDNVDSRRKAEICDAVTNRFGSSVAVIFNDFNEARIDLASKLNTST